MCKQFLLPHLSSQPPFQGEGWGEAFPWEGLGEVLLPILLIAALQPLLDVDELGLLEELAT